MGGVTLRHAAIVALATTTPAATVCTVAKAPQMHLDQIQAKIRRMTKIGSSMLANLMVGSHRIILRVLVPIANVMLTVHATIAQRTLMVRKKNKMIALMVRSKKRKMIALIVRSKKRKMATMMTKKREKKKNDKCEQGRPVVVFYLNTQKKLS